MPEPTPQSVDARMTAHEAVCAERWSTVKARLGRLEGIILVASGTMIVGLFGIIGFLLGPYLRLHS
jgi:hypothetical protein